MGATRVLIQVKRASQSPFRGHGPPVEREARQGLKFNFGQETLGSASGIDTSAVLDSQSVHARASWASRRSTSRRS